MSKRKASSLDPDEVLSGRVKPGAAELVQLIHRENPTGRELPSRAAELRYARKARLQSLLVRSFADELEVAADPSQPGTVSIRHRGHGRDACHALLTSLDDDARSWVQRALDLAASSEPAPVVAEARSSGRGATRAPVDDVDNVDDATPELLLGRAAAAIEAYDYEGARELLERALEVTRGAVEPAAALLSLLVETLGDDLGALALEEKIGKTALLEGQVRTPLALAAARLGREEQALALVRGIDDIHAATVLSALAASVLGAGEIERASAHLDHARRRDPTCPELAQVAGDLARARAIEAEAWAKREAERVEQALQARLRSARVVRSSTLTTSNHEPLRRGPRPRTSLLPRAQPRRPASSTLTSVRKRDLVLTSWFHEQINRAFRLFRP